MRVLVLILAALAGIKIWASNQIYRSAAEEVIVAAYRDRAIAACQRDAGLKDAGPKDAALPRDAKAGASLAQAQSQQAHTLAAQGWANPASIRLVIGRRSADVNVNVWDMDNANWQARYKQAYLVLASADPAIKTACEYDVTANQATLVRS